jgi:hypothetical protein
MITSSSTTKYNKIHKEKKKKAKRKQGKKRGTTIYIIPLSLIRDKSQPIVIILFNLIKQATTMIYV